MIAECQSDIFRCLSLTFSTFFFSFHSAKRKNNNIQMDDFETTE